MEKILTISIAAYNVGSYIRKTLDSIVASDRLDSLEVFIVDDGGADDTLSIAKEYAAKYPDTFFPIHKENGGYGSTVNYSMAHATGKYFKLLDGDDWYDSANLAKTVDALSAQDADVVVNDYEIWRDEEKDSLKRGCELESDTVREIGEISWHEGIGMWAVIFRTALLRSSGLELPHHRLYTDQLFCTIPFAKAETILYLDYPVYCYRVGRDGQSVSRESRIKHLDEALANCYELSEFFEREKTAGNRNIQYLKTRIAKYVWQGFHAILLLPVSKAGEEKAREYDKKIRSISPELAARIAGMNGVWGRHIALCRGTNYKAYWLVGLIPGGVKNWS